MKTESLCLFVLLQLVSDSLTEFEDDLVYCHNIVDANFCELDLLDGFVFETGCRSCTCTDLLPDCHLKRCAIYSYVTTHEYCRHLFNKTARSQKICNWVLRRVTLSLYSLIRWVRLPWINICNWFWELTTVAEALRCVRYYPGLDWDFIIGRYTLFVGANFGTRCEGHWSVTIETCISANDGLLVLVLIFDWQIRQNIWQAAKFYFKTTRFKQIKLFTLRTERVVPAYRVGDLILWLASVSDGTIKSGYLGISVLLRTFFNSVK